MSNLRQTWWQAFSDRECNLVSTWATLAVDAHRNNDRYEAANERHLFVVLVSRVFTMMRLRINNGGPVINDHIKEKITPIENLLSCMNAALRWSLTQSYPNCGAYTALPWVKDILQCYEAAQKSSTFESDLRAAIPLTGCSSLRPAFLLMHISRSAFN